MDRVSHYTPREWLPHERPMLPGSPSTPLHSNWHRAAYAIVAITGGLGNALVLVNLQNLQGTPCRRFQPNGGSRAWP